MSFPEDPRDLKIGFAFGFSAQVDPTLLSYEQVSPGIDPDDPGPVLGTVVVTRGRVGDKPTTDATTIETALRDTDGDFSPRNVAGDHYGQLLLDTPIRVAVDIGAGDQVLATAFQPEWNPAWDGPDINDRVPIQAEGILAGLGRDRDVYSSLRLDIGGRPTTRAYWPMEDGGQAAQFGSGVAGGGPLAFGLIDPAQDDSLAGSRALPLFLAGTHLSGTVESGLFTSGSWSEFWCAKFATAPSVLTTLMQVTATGGSAARWVVAADATTVYLTGYNAAGTPVHSNSSASPTIYNAWFSGDWVTFALSMESGVAASIVATNPATGVGQGLTISSATVNAGAPTGVLVPASAQLADAAMGHICFFDTQFSPIPPAAAMGQPSQSAAERAWYICERSGIANDIDFTAESVAMGPIRPNTRLGLLRECESADHAVLLERRNGRVGFDPRSGRYNLPVSLTLAYGADTDPADISDLQQFDDRRDLANLVTVSRPSGTSATVAKEDGPVGTTALGVRPLPVTLNLASDDQLRFNAGHLLRAGTIDKPRYITVLNLRANPSLAADLIAAGDGYRIAITGAPTKHVGPDDLDLIVEGEVHELGADRWSVTLWCEPFEPYRVQQLADTPPADDVLDGWLIPDRFALRAAVNTALTSWPMDTWPRMATDADEFPARARISGETVAITACATTAATYVAVGAADHDDNAAVTPGNYAGGAVGDWVVVVAGSRDTTSPTLAITDPNYTYELMGQQGGLYWWAAVRTSSNPAPTVTPTGGAAGDTVSASVFGLRNMPLQLPLSQHMLKSWGQTNASAQNIAYGGLRAGQFAGRVILLLARKSDDWTSVAVPSGLTEIAEPSSTSGNDQGLYLAHRIDTTPTALADGALVVTGGGSAVSDSLVIALQGGFQTLTVTRSVNGVSKAHAAGAAVELLDALIPSL